MGCAQSKHSHSPPPSKTSNNQVNGRVNGQQTNVGQPKIDNDVVKSTHVENNLNKAGKDFDTHLSSADSPQQAASKQDEQALRQTLKVSACPFGHGSVGAGPYPGYVHGSHPQICSNGCAPDPQLQKYGRKGESPKETLIREAIEYQELYQGEKKSEPGVKEQRIKAILEEIETTGTYTQTYDEVQHGARVAWRNAPKCSNRKFWEELRLIDARDASTPQEMFDACLECLERATLSCVTTANIVVFRAQTPGTEDGPRVWNNQLIRYCGYKRPDGSVSGDPAETEFTEMVCNTFGWDPPKKLLDAKSKKPWDVLPLLLQAHPDKPPQMFDVPAQYVIRVAIRHPEIEAFSRLGLEWYAVPAVSNTELAVGGLLYTAAPFNGWYCVTEIVRNLTDKGRFDLNAEVAGVLGLDTKNDASMWCDKVIVEITKAVMHSFREAGMGMVDHHTLMKNFYKWYNKELQSRGYCPGNWKWIIPPISPSASECYLNLNKMTEYTLKPGYWYAPGWRNYLKRLKESHPHMFDKGAPKQKQRNSFSYEPIKAATGPKVVILYATVTGNTQQYAEKIANVLSRGCQVSLLSLEDFEPDGYGEKISSSVCTALMTSTYGPGAPPGTAQKFVTWLQKTGGEAQSVWEGRPMCVLGFGSSCYPRFCAAADLMNTLLCSVGAVPVMKVHKADALAGEEISAWSWAQQFVQCMVDKAWLDASHAADVIAKIPVSDDAKGPPFQVEYRLVQISGDDLEPAREVGCYEGKVEEAKELLGDTTAGASTKFVSVDISAVACGNYYSGDEICIWAENSGELVERFALQLGIPQAQLDDMFLLQKINSSEQGGGLDMSKFPLPNTYRTILRKHVGLNEQIAYSAIIALTQCAPEDAKLQSLGDSYDAYQAWAVKVVPRWSDLFDLFPSLVKKVPLAWFFQLVPIIKARYYSISSSSAAAPSAVAMTVGKLAYKLENGDARQGFCSAYISQLQPGDAVRFKLVSQPAFRMPLNLENPVLMVAAGTGLAPFKGFWEERALRKGEGQSLGQAVLLYGCRNTEKDMLHKEGIDEIVRNKVIDKLLLAVSRQPGIKKAYVQDLIPQHAALLKPMLSHPKCHVYVCGSSNMAEEVNSAIGKMVGKQILDAMVLGGRYHEDVFGITVTNVAASKQKAMEKHTIKRLAELPLQDVLNKLDGGVDINGADDSGNTILHHACIKDRNDLAIVLMSRGASASLVNMYGLTPRNEAAARGNDKLAALMASQSAPRTSALHKSFYVLHAAVMEGDVEIARKLIDEGYAADQQDYNMVAPIHIAVSLGDQDMVSLLLKAGAAPNMQNRLGVTPLHIAVERDHLSIVQLLKESGASVNSTQTSAINPYADMWSNEKLGDKLKIDITPDELGLVRAGWTYLSDGAFPDRVGETMRAFGVQMFYALFEMYPSTLELFPFKTPDGKPEEEAMGVHATKVLSALDEVLSRLQHAESLIRYLTNLIERHEQYGVILEHYNILFGTIYSQVQKELKDRFTEADKKAWQKVTQIIVALATQIYKEKGWLNS